MSTRKRPRQGSQDLGPPPKRPTLFRAVSHDSGLQSSTPDEFQLIEANKSLTLRLQELKKEVDSFEQSKDDSDTKKDEYLVSLSKVKTIWDQIDSLCHSYLSSVNQTIEPIGEGEDVIEIIESLSKSLQTSIYATPLTVSQIDVDDDGWDPDFDDDFDANIIPYDDLEESSAKRMLILQRALEAIAKSITKGVSDESLKGLLEKTIIKNKDLMGEVCIRTDQVKVMRRKMNEIRHKYEKSQQNNRAEKQKNRILEEQNKTLLAQLEESQTEVTELEKQLAEPGANANAAGTTENELDDAKMVMEMRQKRIDELEKETVKLNGTIAELTLQLQQSSGGMPNNQEHLNLIQKLQIQYGQLKQDLTVTKEQLMDRQRANETLRIIVQEQSHVFQQMEAESEKLIMEHQQVARSHMIHVDEEKQKLSQKIQELEMDLSRARTEADTARGVKEQLDAISVLNETLKIQMVASEQRVVDQNALNEQKFKEYDDLLKSQRNRTKKAESEKQQLEVKLAERMVHKTPESAKQEMAEMLANQHKTHYQFQQLKERMSDVEKQRNHAIKKYESTKKRIALLEHQSKTLDKQYKECYKKLDEMNSAHGRQLDEIQMKDESAVLNMQTKLNHGEEMRLKDEEIKLLIIKLNSKDEDKFQKNNELEDLSISLSEMQQKAQELEQNSWDLNHKYHKSRMVTDSLEKEVKILRKERDEFKIKSENCDREIRKNSEQLSTVRKKLSRNEESLKVAQRRLQRLSKTATEGDDEELQIMRAEIDDLRGRLQCPVCEDREKKMCLTRCGHLLCEECVQDNIKSRSRKCPRCATTFYQDDAIKVYI